MDDMIASTARFIGLYGDTALRTSAKDLARLARNVASGTVVAGVDAPRNNLVVAATGLDLALEDSEGRSTAVAVLRKAAADLEGAIGAEICAVRDAAAKLASACCEQQGKEMRTAEEATERRDVAQSGRWWSLIWGRKPHLHMEDGTRAHLLDAKQMRIVFCAIEEAVRIQQLEDSAHGFMASVATLGALHDHDEIMGVVGALEEAVIALTDGGFRNSKLVINVSKAAMDFERKLGDYIIALRDPVATLVRECQTHLDAQESMAFVLRADTEMRQRRETWWRFRWLRRHFGTIQESIVAQNEQQHVVRPGQGDGRSSILGFAMLTCIAPIMALGTGVKEKLKLFSHDECIFVVISLCCTLVAARVPFSSYLRSIWEVCFAFVTSSMGMLGMC